MQYGGGGKTHRVPNQTEGGAEPCMCASQFLQVGTKKAKKKKIAVNRPRQPRRPIDGRISPTVAMRDENASVAYILEFGLIGDVM